MEKEKCTRNKTIPQRLEEVRNQLNTCIIAQQKLSSKLIDIIIELEEKEGKK